MTSLTSLLKRIEELDKAATPGPWIADRVRDGFSHRICELHTGPDLFAENREFIDSDGDKANANLIMQSRTLLPLAGEIMRLYGEALEFYAERMNYSVDHDTSEMGVTRRVILFSDQEEINEASIIAGRRAREARARVEELIRGMW